jgi:hypothetical protein
MEPIRIDIFFPVPEGWGLCTTCETMMSQAALVPPPSERGMDEYPADWQEDFKRLTDLIYNLSDQYPDSVQIRIWDPRSFQGLLKSIRYGVRRYPTFIVNGHQKISGWDEHKLDQYIKIYGESENSEI